MVHTNVTADLDCFLFLLSYLIWLSHQATSFSAGYCCVSWQRTWKSVALMSFVSSSLYSTIVPIHFRKAWPSVKSLLDDSSQTEMLLMCFLTLTSNELSKHINYPLSFHILIFSGNVFFSSLFYITGRNSYYAMLQLKK